VSTPGKASEARSEPKASGGGDPPADRRNVLGPGRFGVYGGRYVPETLVAALDELTLAYPAVTARPDFRSELDDLLSTYAGRPTPLSFARRASEALGGARILLKREDLATPVRTRSTTCSGSACSPATWESRA
jgi:hypothetical protein